MKRYVLRDATGYFFKSMCGDGMEAYFTADKECAHQFSKEGMAAFRRDYIHIKGRVVLAEPARKPSNPAQVAATEAQDTPEQKG